MKGRQMQVSQNKTDVWGLLIKLSLICVIWYSECIQQRFFRISNFLLMAGCAMLAFVLLDISYRRIRLREIFPAPSLIIVGFMAYMIIFPSLFAVSFSAHIKQWITSFEYMLVMLCVVYICRTRDCTEFFIKNFMLLYLVMCVIFLSSPVAYKGVGAGRYSFGLYMNPNGFAIGLTTGVFSTLYLVSKKKIPVIIGLGLSLVFLYAVFQTGSRKGLVGCICCIVMWVIIWYIPSGPRRQSLRKLGRFLFILLFIAAALVVLKPYYANSALARRMTYAIEEMLSGTRGGMYSLGYDLWKQNPIFGIGFQGFSRYYPTGSYSHATLVEVPVSGGTVGLLLYLAAYFILLKDIVKKIRQDRRMPDAPDKAVLQHRMALIMLGLLAINFVCIIHPYQLDSNVNFGLTAALCYGMTQITKQGVNREQDVDTYNR
jgi:O-antigen ligase